MLTKIGSILFTCTLLALGVYTYITEPLWAGKALGVVIIMYLIEKFYYKLENYLGEKRRQQ